MEIGVDEYVTMLKNPATGDGPKDKSFGRKAWLSKELPHSYFPLTGLAGQVVVIGRFCFNKFPLHIFCFLLLLKTFTFLFFFFLSFGF